MRATGPVPGYWANEASGVLRPSIMAYLEGRPLSEQDIARIRAYCAQWINAWWPGDPDKIAELRATVDGLTSRAQINAWIARAVEAGIDPL